VGFVDIGFRVIQFHRVNGFKRAPTCVVSLSPYQLDLDTCAC